MRRYLLAYRSRQVFEMEEMILSRPNIFLIMEPSYPKLQCENQTLFCPTSVVRCPVHSPKVQAKQRFFGGVCLKALVVFDPDRGLWAANTQKTVFAKRLGMDEDFLFLFYLKKERDKRITVILNLSIKPWVV